MEAKETIDFTTIKEREKEFRRSLIMDAAVNLFASKPFDKVQMREIAAAVGLSPGSIYTYFPNQEALFLDAVIRGLDHLGEMYDDVIKNQNGSLEGMMNGYIDVIMEHFEYFRMCQHCILYGKFDSEESLTKIKVAYRTLFDKCDVIISRYVKDENVRSHSHLIFSSLNGILLSFGRYPGRSKEEILTHMKKLGNLLTDLYKKEAGISL